MKRKSLQDENSESADEESDLEYYYLVWCDNFSNSRPGEEWIQCIECKN